MMAAFSTTFPIAIRALTVVIAAQTAMLWFASEGVDSLVSGHSVRACSPTDRGIPPFLSLLVLRWHSLFTPLPPRRVKMTAMRHMNRTRRRANPPEERVRLYDTWGQRLAQTLAASTPDLPAIINHLYQHAVSRFHTKRQPSPTVDPPTPKDCGGQARKPA